jgi:hypothetical protein
MRRLVNLAGFGLTFVLLAGPAPAAEAVLHERCPLEPGEAAGEVLVAWMGARHKAGRDTVESFRPVAVIQGPSIRESYGSTIAKGRKFWLALAPDSPPATLASAGSIYYRTGRDRCVYQGTLEQPDPAPWTLLTSKPLPGVFRPPTDQEKREFRMRMPRCQVQGDYPEGQEPPCVMAEIIAVTDIDEDGQPEYWAREPYMWDTGLSVLEDRGTLVPLLRLCPGCSD